MAKIDPDQIAYGGFETGHTVRSDMAKAMMQGLLAQGGTRGWPRGQKVSYNDLASHAIAATDALIDALNHPASEILEPDPSKDILNPF